MEALIKNASVAWNPVAAIRDRAEDGTLTIGKVLPVFLAISVACGIAYATAENHYWKTLVFAMGESIPGLDNPLLSAFAQQFLATITVLAPAGILALLPRSIFGTAGKDQAISAVIILSASWLFYGASFKTVSAFGLSLMAQSDPEGSLSMYLASGLVIAILILILMVGFWIKSMISVLGMSVAQCAAIALVSVVSVAVVGWIIVGTIPDEPFRR